MYIGIVVGAAGAVSTLVLLTRLMVADDRYAVNSKASENANLNVE